MKYTRPASDQLQCCRGNPHLLPCWEEDCPDGIGKLVIYTSHWFVKRSHNRQQYLTKRQAEADVEQQLWNDVQTGAIQDFEHVITRVLPRQYEVVFEVTRET